jgi:hypothetical protein
VFFHPLPDPGPPPTAPSGSGGGYDRDTIVRFDVACRTIASGPDGTLWLASEFTVYQLAVG